MVALRLFSLLLVVGYALPAYALTFPYESVGQGGDNGSYDSNGESCDNTPFYTDGAWQPDPNLPGYNPGQGCYNRTGGLCSADTNHMCDLQIVPQGRCSFGDVTTGPGPAGPGGSTCLWPHHAGHCQGNTRVGCLTDAYILNSANTASGASSMCTGTGDATCSMTTDPYGGAFAPTVCSCDGASAASESSVCGTGSDGKTKPICSDGDPTRDVGGWGSALGVQLNLGTSLGVSFANMGPSINGSSQPVASPPYPQENLASNDTIEPQRAPGSLNRSGLALTPIVKSRTTDARDVDPSFNVATGITKMRNFGDSYWGDWVFVSVGVTGTYNTHIVVYPCDPGIGYTTDQRLDPTPGAPNSGDEGYCSELGRDSFTFLWTKTLTPAEQVGPCPPNCGVDFDVTTVELEAFIAAGLKDPDAGVQLALQSGEGPKANNGDAIGVAAVTAITWLNPNDMRCKMGGWGGALVGRCGDGPDACDPTLNDPNTGNNALCTTQGNSCRACGGPITLANPRGLPIGYNTHGLPELDLETGKRIGGITGEAALVRVPLFVVGTTGLAASDFRDLPGSGAGTQDLANMGRVDPISTFAVGVGAGGTFGTGLLPIGEDCCTPTPGDPAGGTPIVWAPDAVGTPFTGTTFNRTFDRGPGPDGIPGCANDTIAQSNGRDACKNRLGHGADGAKTNGFFATGKDDIPTTYNVGTSGVIPASDNRFGVLPATAEVVTHFQGPPYNYASPNPPSFNTIAAFTFRDINVFGTQNTDILDKVNSTFCPLVGNSAKCPSLGPPPADEDGDGVPDSVDNCRTVANGPAQAGVANVGNQLDTDSDLVGDACDNCRAIANPRVAATFITTNAWATTTGDQRDDDHDGYGNKCDAKFPQAAGAAVGTNDLAQFRTAFNKARTGDTCGTSGTKPCAIFDLDEAAAGAIGTGDLNQFRALFNKAPGPKCAACPLPCANGTAGTCGALP